MITRLLNLERSVTKMTIAELKQELNNYPDNFEIYIGVGENKIVGVYEAQIRIFNTQPIEQSILIHNFHEKDDASVKNAWTILS